MGESFKEFCYKLKNLFNNKVYVEDVNNNEPIGFSIREIKIDNGFLYLDGRKVRIPNSENATIIIVNGGVEKIENCENVFVAEDVNIVNNVSSLICRDVESNIVADNVEVSGNVEGSVHANTITCNDVGGNALTHMNLSCGNIAGNASARCDIEIKGNIGGDIKGRDISIQGDIDGNVISSRSFAQEGDIHGDVYETFDRVDDEDMDDEYDFYDEDGGDDELFYAPDYDTDIFEF